MPVRKAPEDAASPPQNGSATGGRVPAGREVTRWPRHLSPESPARWPSLTQHPSDAAGGAGQTVAPSAPDPPDPPPRPWGLGDDCSSPRGGQATAGSPPHPVTPRCCGVLSAAFPAPHLGTVSFRMWCWCVFATPAPRVGDTSPGGACSTAGAPLVSHRGRAGWQKSDCCRRALEGMRNGGHVGLVGAQPGGSLGHTEGLCVHVQVPSTHTCATPVTQVPFPASHPLWCV